MFKNSLSIDSTKTLSLEERKIQKQEEDTVSNTTSDSNPQPVDRSRRSAQEENKILKPIVTDYAEILDPVAFMNIQCQDGNVTKRKIANIISKKIGVSPDSIFTWLKGTYNQQKQIEPNLGLRTKNSLYEHIKQTVSQTTDTKLQKKLQDMLDKLISIKDRRASHTEKGKPPSKMDTGSTEPVSKRPKVAKKQNKISTEDTTPEVPHSSNESINLDGYEKHKLSSHENNTLLTSVVDEPDVSKRNAAKLPQLIAEKAELVTDTVPEVTNSVTTLRESVLYLPALKRLIKLLAIEETQAVEIEKQTAALFEKYSKSIKDAQFLLKKSLVKPNFADEDIKIKFADEDIKIKYEEIKKKFNKGKKALSTTGEKNLKCGINAFLEGYLLCCELVETDSSHKKIHEQNALRMAQHMEWGIKLLADAGRETFEQENASFSSSLYKSEEPRSFDPVVVTLKSDFFTKYKTKDKNNKIRTEGATGSQQKSNNQALQLVATLNAHVICEGKFTGKELETYVQTIFDAYDNLVKKKITGNPYLLKGVISKPVQSTTESLTTSISEDTTRVKLQELLKEEEIKNSDNNSTFSLPNSMFLGNELSG